MKRLIPLFTFTLFLHLSLLAAVELVVYSSATLPAPLHVETVSTNATEKPRRWDFPSSYTGHRAVCKLDGAKTNDTFKAWIGGDTYKPADPFGVKFGNFNAIELTETHPAFARMPYAYTKGSSDREIAFGGSTTTMETNAQGQVIMHYGSSDVEINPDYTGSVADLLGTGLTRIRVKRARVDGQKATQGSLTHRVIYDQYVPTSSRSFICEYDVIGANEFDIDWANFRNEVLEDDIVFGHGLPVTQVVYRVCFGEGPFNINTHLERDEPWIEVSRRFEKSRSLPSELSADVRESRPVFYWRMRESFNPQYADTYTAFRLQIDGAYDSGMRFRPPRGADGRFRWECPQDMPSGDYTWRVSMYNAKFQTNAWSTATFTIP